LAKRFGEVTAVSDVSFAVKPGEIFGLLGPNGAGKTTTIRMMLDIFKPDAGTVSIFGGSLNLSGKRRIGYLPEERGLYKNQKLDATLVYLATLKGWIKDRPGTAWNIGCNALTWPATGRKRCKT
jgi:ABC-2 type transport system ATP-binding protein